MRWLAALLVAVLLAGCGGSEEQEASPPAAGATATPAPATGADAEPTVQGATDTDSKPAISIPDAQPPGALRAEDLVEGDGRTARAGDGVSVQYVGAAWSTGQEFDASWDRGEPLDFPLGAGQVIPGWDEGVAGMKVGGRRLLVIPPEQAYGPQGQPPVIGPNETLVFVVDLLAVERG